MSVMVLWLIEIRKLDTGSKVINKSYFPVFNDLLPVGEGRQNVREAVPQLRRDLCHHRCSQVAHQESLGNRESTAARGSILMHRTSCARDLVYTVF